MQARPTSSCGACLSVCLSVCLSLSLSLSLSVCVSCSRILSKRINIFKKFSQSGSQAILVFLYQTACQYYDRNPSNQIKYYYNSVVQEYVPLVRTRNKRKFCFLSNKTKKMINKRERLFRRYCKTRRGIDFDKYRKIRNRVNAAIRKEKLEEEERKCQVFKTNKKAFYGYVKSKQKVTSRNLRVHTVNGSVTKTEAETAEELNKFFKSVYIQEDDCQIPDFHPTGLLKPPNQDKIVVSEEDVYKQLSTLNENKSPGPDNIHPAVLKKMAGVWTYPLTTLCQTSLQTGTLPSDWLLANVTPTFKKGSRSDVSNYRPVALTSVLCKMHY